MNGGRERRSTHGELTATPEGFVLITLPQGADVDGEEMRQILDALWDFAPGRRPVLIDGRGASRISAEAREVVTTGQAAEWTSALALVLDSVVSAVVADFVLMLARPPFPVRVFREVEPARAWLASTD